MLHARPGNSLDFVKIRALPFQPLQHEIDGLEEQRDGRKDLAFGWVGENALVDTIFRKVGVEIDFGFVDEFEVGADDDAWYV
jgi:hypothetical protein